MSDKKGKNILALMGVYDGHIPGMIEIVKDLVSLGYDVTCYVRDKFEERLKITNAKLKVITLPKTFQLPPDAPKRAVESFIFAHCYDLIIDDALKSQEKYDYLLIDSFFDGNEINKFFKIPTIVSVYIFPIGEEISYIKATQKGRLVPFIIVNKKYNINIRDFLEVHYNGESKYKLMLTSKLFHPDIKSIDDSFYFLGPSLEKRPIDNNFKFKKEENKQLIYISLGTVFNNNLDFYKKCIEAFGNSKEFQLLMSIGKYLEIKDLGDLPENIVAFNFVPQLQVLKQADIFITHGGINSINEGILNNLPLIVYPQVLDQFDNAKQVEKYEAGIMLHNDNLTPEIIKNVVNTIIKNKEKYKNGVQKICQSFLEAREERKKIFEKIFV